MAPSIATLDTIEDASARKDQQGWHVVRKAVVVGLDADASVQARMVQAATVVGIPQYGEFAQGIPAPFVSVVASIEATPLSNTSATVTINYEPIGLGGLTETAIDENAGTNIPGGARISVRTALQQVTTNKDEDGNQIVLWHAESTYDKDVEGPIPPAGGPPVLHRKGEAKPQVGEIQMFIPTVVLTFERRERKNPREKAMRFVGRVDPDNVFGDPPRSWMCTRLDGVSIDGTSSYQVTYEFTRSVEEQGIDRQPTSGWDTIVAAYDHENNTFFVHPLPEPDPPDPTVLVGIRQIKRPLEANFEDLNLIVPY
jgi:hypothetical protein